MKIFLTTLLLLSLCTQLPAQSDHELADSLAYWQGHVLAYKNGTLYRPYQIGYKYPRFAAEAGIEGVMVAEGQLDSTCHVIQIDYYNSLGSRFEDEIEKTMRRASKVFRDYNYRNCEQVMLRDSITYKLD